MRPRAAVPDHRRLTRSAVALAVAWLLLFSPSEPAVGQDVSALDQARASLPAELLAVPASSTQLDRTTAQIIELESRITANRRIRDESIFDLARLRSEQEVLRERVLTHRASRRSAGLEAEGLRTDLAELSVEAYVSSGNSVSLGDEETLDSGRRRAMFDSVDESLRTLLAETEEEIADSAQRVEHARQALDSVESAIVTAQTALDLAVAELAVDEPEIIAAQQRYHDQFLTAPITGSDLTVVAYDAYRLAASTLASEQPDCRVSWTVLAAIGRSESRHGTVQGSRLLPTGSTSRRIRGPALDGAGAFAHVGDSDDGVLDGDTEYDRAIGPMQFLPSTWRSVRHDGNSDGRMDPHNIYDAALAAGAYLCRSATRLDRAAPLHDALLSYNRSESYVNTILGYRRTYERLGLPG